MTLMSNTAQIVEDSIVKTIHYDKLKYTTCLYAVYVMERIVERVGPKEAQ